jgi:hypothetical protein
MHNDLVVIWFVVGFSQVPDMYAMYDVVYNIGYECSDLSQNSMRQTRHSVGGLVRHRGGS